MRASAGAGAGAGAGAVAVAVAGVRDIQPQSAVSFRASTAPSTSPPDTVIRTTLPRCCVAVGARVEETAARNDGSAVGRLVGTVDGTFDGAFDGRSVGAALGKGVGCGDGTAVGLNVGRVVEAGLSSAHLCVRLSMFVFKAETVTDHKAMSARHDE